MKTRKSITKRFKFTKNGKVLRRATGLDHLRRRKSKRTKQRQKKWVEVPKALARKIKSLRKY
jgi:large subunit ribosomal protein L35